MDWTQQGPQDSITPMSEENQSSKLIMKCTQGIPLDDAFNKPTCTKGSWQGVRRIGKKGGMVEDDAEELETTDLQGGSGEANQQKNMALLLQGMTLEENTRGLLISQMRGPSVYVEEGMMWLLQNCLEEDHGKGSTVVLSGFIVHFESTVKEDLGWGCGWRNIQMLSSFLLAQDPAIREVLFGGAGFIPDIAAMQRWLEIAWAKGFDISGADYFDWRISGTKKWIGTTECAALLRSFGVRARIIDFRVVGSKRGGADTAIGSKSAEQHKSKGGGTSYLDPTSSDTVGGGGGDSVGQFPGVSEEITKEQRNWGSSTGGGGGSMDKVNVSHNHMIDWIWNYFSGDDGDRSKLKHISLSRRSPLYFQHRGHSRTIVGIQRSRKERTSKNEDDYLIILDPSQNTIDIMNSLRQKQGWENLVKRGMLSLMEQAEYQLCYIEPGIATDEELESLKVLSSIRYLY